MKNLYLISYKVPAGYVSGYTYMGIFTATDEEELREKVKDKVETPYNKFNSDYLSFAACDDGLIQVATEESSYNDY